jgi:hypothetical protein
MTRIKALFFFLFLAWSNCNAQGNFDRNDRKSLNIRKYGPFLGIQKGISTLPEIGAECQWKRVGLIQSGKTHALQAGMTYNFSENVVGYDIGYWTKSGSFGLTYGLRGALRSNFSASTLGFTPTVGFSFLQFHVETGYYLFFNPKSILNPNKLFVSLRFVLIRDRKVSLN